MWLCSRLGFYVTAVAPVLTDQRTYALRLGGHVLSRHFRYYVPELSGRIVVQTPLTVRWVPMLILISFVWFQFLCPFFAVGCCWLLVDSLVLEICLDKCYFHSWWWFSVLKGFLLLFILLNDVRCCVFVGFYLRSSRFFRWLCFLFLRNFIVVDGCGMDGWFLLVLMTISHVVWVCEFVQAGEIFARWALSSGENWYYLLVLLWWVVFITYGWRGFIVLLGFCCFLISAFIR